MGLNGLEPATSRLSGVRSNHLSYRPMTGARGLEPPAFGFGDRRSTTYYSDDVFYITSCI